ncbi:MerR family transcriptional regulator [Spirillospora sp. CA-294931]|uniref:MerR family transcriptional regulator n=1 Tax=Spirillospora sp. CA-294931 TaxID=3240042 RepID=UPI003D8D6E0A
MDHDGPATAAEPGYGIGAVARLIGVPANTLRTWNVRYGVGPSRRSAGGHRRYDASDLRRLESMKRLVGSGLPPSEAARTVLTRPVPDEAEEPPGTPAVAGRVPSPAMLARAALALDGRGVAGGLAAGIARNGVARTWNDLVLPVFEAIVARQERDGGCVAAEHLFSDRLLAALHPLVGEPARPVNGRPVLLACARDEQHSLPIYALAAVLGTDHGIGTRILGARTPYSALAEAMRTLGPAVVFVWSSQAETGDPAPLADLPRVRPPSRLVVGGPGWHSGLPARVARVHSLDEAVRHILDTL